LYGAARSRDATLVSAVAELFVAVFEVVGIADFGMGAVEPETAVVETAVAEPAVDETVAAEIAVVEMTNLNVAEKQDAVRGQA